MYLTKSKYVKGMQCPKMLWMDVNMPEEAISKAMPSILENGLRTGEVARNYFGDHSLVEFSFNEQAMCRETVRLMNEGVENIAEATFVYQDLLCRVDILHFNGSGYDIVEVKSSTKVRDEYYFDVSFQYFVLTMAGVRVDNVYLMHVNNEYYRYGELDLQELFIKEDVTEYAKSLAGSVKVNADEFLNFMKQGTEPERDIGIYCENPFECDYKEYCSRHLPSPSVLDVAGLYKSKKYRYYQEGIVSFSDLATKPSLLNAKQRRQVETELNDEPDTVLKERIIGFLNTLSYPMYHLDFETFQPAVPPFDGTKPWMQIPFQYSLHIQKEKNGPLEHREHLAKEGTDPRRKLAEQLCRDIPMDVCSLAYNMRFEQMIIKQLAETYDDLADHLMNIHDHMCDLMIPFKEQYYYSKKLKGSYSIKYVLPAMCPDDPELDYTSLDQIHNGTEAMDAFPRMGNGSMTPEEIEQTRRNLLAYCRLDTLAMVKVLERLQELVEENGHDIVSEKRYSSLTSEKKDNEPSSPENKQVDSNSMMGEQGEILTVIKELSKEESEIGPSDIVRATGKSRTEVLTLLKLLKESNQIIIDNDKGWISLNVDKEARTYPNKEPSDSKNTTQLQGGINMTDKAVEALAREMAERMLQEMLEKQAVAAAEAAEKSSSTSKSAEPVAKEEIGGSFKEDSTLLEMGKEEKVPIEIEEPVSRNVNISDTALRMLEHHYSTEEYRKHGTLEEALQKLGGMTIQPKNGRLYIMKAQNTGRSVTIPYGIDHIAGHAFQGNEMLEEISIPATVVRIGRESFEGCPNLRKVIIDEGLLKLEERAFANCTGLNAITLPASLKLVYNGCFAGCSSLSDVEIKNSKVEYPSDAFEGCPFMKENNDGINRMDNKARDEEIQSNAKIKHNDVPDVLKRKIESMQRRLEEYYPDHVIPRAIQADHKNLADDISDLYRLLNYSDAKAMLADYGYDYQIEPKKGTSHEVSAIDVDDNSKTNSRSQSGSNEMPEAVKRKVDSVLRRLEEYYPDHIIPRAIQADHKNLGEDVSVLYRLLGYSDAKAMLADYGYDYQATAGRKKNDYTVLIDALQEKYKDKQKPESWGKLVFENPEYKSQLKSFTNSAQELVGTTAVKYFRQIGLLAERGRQVSTVSAKPKKKYSAISDTALRMLEHNYNTEEYRKHGTLEDALNQLEGMEVRPKNGRLVIMRASDIGRSISIPYGINQIAAHAFEEKDMLEEVSIPSTVSRIGLEAFAGCSNLRKVTMDEGIEKIEERAFANCSSLGEITLPASLNMIGDGGFKECAALSDVVMKNEFTQYGQGVFDGCPYEPKNEMDADATDASLFEITKNARNEVSIIRYKGHDHKVVIPKMIDGGIVKTIGKVAFNGNTYLQEVVMPDCIETVQGGAFADCISLKKVHLSERMSKVVTKTFTGCTALEEVNIPDNTKELKSGTFSSAPLKTLHIGKSLELMTGSAFYGGEVDPVTYKLVKGRDTRTITIDPQNPHLKVVDSMILSSDGKTLFIMLGGDSKCTIPDGVEIIGKGAFENQVQLTDVVFPDSLKVIEEKAFRETSLRSIYFPAGLESIGSYAFHHCTKLTSVIFNEGLETIAEYAFHDAPIAVVNLPSTVKQLEQNSFAALSSYSETKQQINIDPRNENMWSDGSAIYIKDKGKLILSILYDADFKSYYYSGYDYDDYEDDDYENDYHSGSDREYEVAEGTIGIAEAACSNCRGLLSIYLPESVKYISDNAFANCTELRNINIPDGLEIIGKGVFRETKLSELTIPASVKEIGSAAFAVGSETRWKSITVDPNNPTFFIEDGNLYQKNDDGTTTLITHFGNQEVSTLRSDVLRIQKGAFTNSITEEIMIPVSVKYIEEKAITGCKKLKRLNIGQSQMAGRLNHSVIYLPKGELDNTDSYNYDYQANWRLNQMREQYMDCLRITVDEGLFDYAKYDSLFDSVTDMDDKILIATDRLKSPTMLIPVYEENYRRFLQTNATDAVSTVVRDDDVNGLIVLADLEIFNQSNIDSVIELANKAKKPEVLSYLMNFKNSNIGATSDDYEL